MATVPRLERSISQSGAPSVSVSTSAPAGAFGGGNASTVQSLAKLSTGVLDIAAKNNEEANELRITEADNAFIESEDAVVWDAENGLMNREGKNAFGISDEYNKGYKDRLDKAVAGLSNEAQKEKFKLIAEEHRLSTSKNLERRMGSEIKKHQVNTSKAYIKNQVTHAQRNYANPAEIEIAEKKASMKFGALAKMQGMSSDEIKQGEQDNKDLIYAGVVSRYIDSGDDQNGKLMFEKYKDKMSPTFQDKIKKGLEAVRIKGESQRQTDALMQDDGDLTAKLVQARKIKDPAVRDEVVKRVKLRTDENEEAIKINSENAHKEAFGIINETPNMDLIPETMKDKLTTSQLQDLESWASKKRKGTTIQTNLPVYYQLQQMASVPELQDQFMKTNLLTHINDLSPTDFKAIGDLQAGLRKGDATVADQINGIQSDAALINDTLLKIGVKKDSLDAVKFRRKVDQHVLNWKRVNEKKNIPTEKLQEIADLLITTGEVDGSGFFSDDKRLFQVQPGEQFDLEIDDVPAEERSKIIEALRRNGKPENDANVIDTYLKKLQRVAK